LWWPFWKWRPVEIFQCLQSIRDIIIYPHIKFCHNTAQIQHCSISTSWIDCRHWKISTGLHFQNGHHNTAKIQHCSISKVCYPNQNWSSYVVDVFPFIGWDFYQTWPWTTQRVCDFRLTLLLKVRAP
jgi:hypothetical protein